MDQVKSVRNYAIEALDCFDKMAKPEIQNRVMGSIWNYIFKYILKTINKKPEKELKEKLDLLTSDKPLDIYREIYRYYCQKSKPINTQTIQGYYLTHCFQNNIISLDKFIKHTHSKTLSF